MERSGGPRALLVEDDDRIRRVLTVGPGDEGIEVREPASADELSPCSTRASTSR